MSNQSAPLEADADWRPFMHELNGNSNLRYAALTEHKEEAKGLKRIDRESALSCITDTVCILVSKLPEAEKKKIVEKILAAPVRRRPRFDDLEQVRDQMQQMLEQLSQKENAANLQKELIEEKYKLMQKFIEKQEALKTEQPDEFSHSKFDLD